MRRHSTVSLLMACALATPVHAQDGSEQAMNRTPVNAQKFLAAYPPRLLQTSKNNATNMYLHTGEKASPDVCVTRFGAFRARPVNGDWIKENPVDYQVKAGIGITYATGNKEMRENHKMPDGVGLIVGDVTPNSEAERIGVKPGMVIRYVMKQDATIERLNQAIATTKPGSKIYLGIMTSPSASPRFLQFPVVEERVSRLVDADPLPIEIDWSKVQQVSAQDGNGSSGIMLYAPGDRYYASLWLSYPAPATRDRVLAAAQYLQQVCDKAKDLGF